jgi:hypothetical protein
LITYTINDPPLSSGAIAGIVIGSIVLVGIIVTVIICVNKKGKKGEVKNVPMKVAGENQPYS